MKKTIGLLLILILVTNCFGQTAIKPKADTTLLSKIDSIKAMAMPTFSIDDLENFNKTLRKTMTVDHYEQVFPILQYLNQLFWQKAQEIRKLKK